MAFRNWKKGLVIFIIAWIAFLSYFALTDYLSNATEGKQLQRAKRVLTKSQLLINKLQTEINSLQQEVSRLQQNCKKKCPLVRSLAEEKVVSDVQDRRARSALRTAEDFQNLTESQHKKATSLHEFSKQVPGFKLKIIQQRASKELREMWYYLSAEVTKINKLLGSSLKARLTAMLDNFAEIHRALSNNLDKINNQESLLTWRKEEQEKLSKLVQYRLKRLQNPQDCDAARKLICDLNKGCGYGCQVHHLLYCFITAYGAERTLIVNSQGWRYSEKGWEGVFLPVSDTCTIAKGPLTIWSTDSDEKKNVQLPIVDALYPQPKHLPLAVPADLAEQIQSFHGFPFVWWIGQFAKYLFRYQPEMKKEIDERKAKLGFKSPIVGVHVRRTDKINVEASYHSLEEYMYWVDLYFKKISLTQEVHAKNVYLASDDATVLPEAKKKYPGYNFVSDNDISKAAGMQNRYSDESLHGVIFDIQMLSECDYIVCTFSSQVCRVAYEMMQANSPTDASERIQSLDDVYYFGGQLVNDVQAVYSYTARNYEEINMKPGDRLKIAGNHWDGYSKATSRARQKTGMFPSYLVEKYVHIVDFPHYSDFDKELEANST